MATACGDDSKAIAEQWPDHTAGSAGPKSSTGVGAEPSTASGDTTTPSTTATASGSSSTSGSLSSSTPAEDSSSPGTTGTQAPDPLACTPDRFRCVDAVPAGWSGPVAHKGKNAQGIVPACDDEYRFAVNAVPYHAQPSFNPASCSACSCGTPSGAKCERIAKVEYFSDKGCNRLLTEVPNVLADGTCSAVVGAQGNARSVRIPRPVVDVKQVACQPMGGFATKTGFSWDTQERLCRSRSADSLKCADPSQVCTPKVAASFVQSVCIYQNGDHACPASRYKNKLVLYKGVTDDRGCEACACGQVVGNLTCEGDFLQFSDKDCLGSMNGTQEAVRLTGSPSTCADLRFFGTSQSSAGVPLGVSLDVAVGGLNTASCAVSGGTPSGRVAGTEPVTLCCTDN